MSAYPEHDKIKALAGKNEIVGHFLEWLGENQFVVAEWERQKECGADSGWFSTARAWHCINGRMIRDETADDPGRDVGECESCDGTSVVDRIEPRLMPNRLGIEKLLAMYFDIDLEKLAAEKDRILKDFEKELNW